MPINLPHNPTKFRPLYKKGRDEFSRQKKERDLTKLGQFRIGTSGAIINGEIYGECHRKALLRYLGVETEFSEETLDIFDAGFNNEYTWEKYLSSALKDTQTVKKDHAVSWTIQEGKVGTGSADLVIIANNSETFLPMYGIELKASNSVDQAVKIFCNDEFDVKNLIQAAHYSLRNQIPFTLIYTYRGISITPFWANKWADKLRKKKNTYYLHPFIKEYPIGFDNGFVYYMIEDKKIQTKISAEGIDDYYKLILEMEEKKKLYHRVTKLDLAGNSLPYDPCNYCTFQNVCDDFEHNFDAWLDKAKLITGSKL